MFDDKDEKEQWEEDQKVLSLSFINTLWKLNLFANESV